MDSLPEIGLALAFLGGLLSFFSPCVAPLVPGYLSFIAGMSTATGQSSGQTPVVSGLSKHPLESARKMSDTGQRTLQTVGASLIFVLGFTLVFVALGAGAALFGGLLEAYRQPLNRVTGVVMIGMGLVLAEVVRIPMLNQEQRIHLDARALGPSAPLLLGMTFAFGWVPCVGPILAGILLYAGSTATVGAGVWLLFAYSVGLGVPFVLSGVAATWVLGTGRGLRRYWPWITRFSGAFLVLIGILFVTDRFFYLSIAMQRLYYSIAY
ncbi:MAG: cytochrome c biogenesis protein CcdA [Caldilineaceae bacterium]|nr:cytochrome c biogenesis protein CcdA [Caldilineaceae bacterium]